MHIGYARRLVFLQDLALFAAFERLIDPYPDTVPPPAPRGLWPFIWANTLGVRRFVAVMTALTAVIGAFEALLFAFLGQLVDGLSATSPERWWPEERAALLAVAAVLVASPLLIAWQALAKYQRP